MISAVNRSYRYRLKPTRRQARALMAWLAMTRELYNAALQERRDAWKKCGVSVSMYDQSRALAEVRDARPEFRRVPVVVLRGALRRLNGAFGAFFNRVKVGEKPGFPRFKGAHRFNTISIDDLRKRNPLDTDRRRLAIPMLGKVKIDIHRPMEGAPKTMRLTLDNGRWYASIQCVDVPTKPLAPAGHEVGVDLGLRSFAVTSDGEVFENPRVLRRAENAVSRAQRRVSKKRRGGRNRRKAAQRLARRHGQLRNTRREHHIQVARALVATNDLICVEALNIKGLARSRLSKSVYDVGWGSFLGWLRTKAEEAARVVVEVNPAGTSQTCSACGDEVRKSLAVRVHRCPCGLVVDRDENAALNILAAGRAVRREALRSKGTSATREVRVRTTRSVHASNGSGVT